MIAVTTASTIEDNQVKAYKGTAQDATFEEFLCSVESLGANAVLNTCYVDALDVDTLFHGAAVVIKHTPAPPRYQQGEGSVFSADSLTGPIREAK